MEGGSNGMMVFGENSSSMMMPAPFMTSHHHQHQHQHQHHQHHQHQQHQHHGGDHSNHTTSPFHQLLHQLPLTNHHQDNHRTTIPASGGGSAFSSIFQDHHQQNQAAAAAAASGRYFLDIPTTTTNNNNNNMDITNNINGGGSSSSYTSVKAKIMAHPHYHRLLASYISCQKVGAPPEVVARLEEACVSAASIGQMVSSGNGSGCIGEDPALDQFMEAYCEMLTKYEQELSKPFKEAMIFLHRIESQFKALALSSSSDSAACTAEGVDRNGSSEEDVDVNNNLVDPQAEDRELKGQLLRKYSGYLGSLKQEFLKKRKKGKLPKEARQQLLDWWSRHYKWPYPSESQKLALAESTGLDQKQINNWFINQRKRHWKPSEDMQFVVMDAAHSGHYYMDTVLGNPFPMDVAPTLL